MQVVSVLITAVLCSHLRLTLGTGVNKGEPCTDDADCKANECGETWNDLTNADRVKCDTSIPVKCINKVCLENSCSSKDGKTFGGKALSAYAEGGRIGSTSASQEECNSGTTGPGRGYGHCSCDGTTYWDTREYTLGATTKKCGCQSCTAGNGCVVHECETDEHCDTVRTAKENICYKEDLAGNRPNLCVECTQHAHCNVNGVNTGIFCSKDGKCETGCAPLTQDGWINDEISNTEYSYNRDLPCKHLSATPFCCIHNYRGISECDNLKCTECRGTDFRDDCARGQHCIKNSDNKFECLECATDKDCEVDPSKPRCKGSVCIAGCESNLHCPAWAGNGPVCDVASMKCVQCAIDKDCAAMWGDSSICKEMKCKYPEASATEETNTAKLSSESSSTDGGYGYGYGEAEDDVEEKVDATGSVIYLPPSSNAIAMITISVLDFKGVALKAQNGIVFKSVELTLRGELKVESKLLRMQKCDSKRKVCYLTAKDNSKSGIRAAFKVDVTNADYTKINQILTAVKRLNSIGAASKIQASFEVHFNKEVEKYLSANPTSPSAENVTIVSDGISAVNDPMMLVYILVGVGAVVFFLCVCGICLLRKSSKDKVQDLADDDDFFDDDGNPIPTVRVSKPTFKIAPSA